jgi:formylglycine-generating enzyme required for sulfatase activity
MNFFRMTLCLAACLLLPAAAPRPKETTTGGGVHMVLLSGGTYVMGAEDAGTDAPPHAVTVGAFYIDKTAVTQAEYVRLMGENPSRFRDPANPVEQVGWIGAARYCNRRSREEGLEYVYDEATWEINYAANGYRLPTEAEWEYACRAGAATRYYFGDDAGKLPFFAWFKENASGRARGVGKKLPNRWGLLDMSGNVWEWCNDWYEAGYYKKSPRENPKGPATGKYRVVRGGAWNSPAKACTSANRFREEPGYGDICIVGYDVYGFRCVRRAG